MRSNNNNIYDILLYGFNGMFLLPIQEIASLGLSTGSKDILNNRYNIRVLHNIIVHN